eukprot:gene23891-biopygen4366
MSADCQRNARELKSVARTWSLLPVHGVCCPETYANSKRTGAVPMSAPPQAKQVPVPLRLLDERARAHGAQPARNPLSFPPPYPLPHRTDLRKLTAAGNRAAHRTGGMGRAAVRLCTWFGDGFRGTGVGEEITRQPAGCPLPLARTGRCSTQSKPTCRRSTAPPSNLWNTLHHCFHPAHDGGGGPHPIKFPAHRQPPPVSFAPPPIMLRYILNRGSVHALLPSRPARGPLGGTAEDASGTRPFLHILSCGRRPQPFLPVAGVARAEHRARADFRRFGWVSQKSGVKWRPAGTDPVVDGTFSRALGGWAGGWRKAGHRFFLAESEPFSLLFCGRGFQGGVLRTLVYMGNWRRGTPRTSLEPDWCNWGNWGVTEGELQTPVGGGGRLLASLVLAQHGAELVPALWGRKVHLPDSVEPRFALLQVDLTQLTGRSDRGRRIVNSNLLATPMMVAAGRTPTQHGNARTTGKCGPPVGRSHATRAANNLPCISRVNKCEAAQAKQNVPPSSKTLYSLIPSVPFACLEPARRRSPTGRGRGRLMWRREKRPRTRPTRWNVKKRTRPGRVLGRFSQLVDSGAQPACAHATGPVRPPAEGDEGAQRLGLALLRNAVRRRLGHRTAPAGRPSAPFRDPQKRQRAWTGRRPHNRIEETNMAQTRGAGRWALRACAQSTGSYRKKAAFLWTTTFWTSKSTSTSPAGDTLQNAPWGEQDQPVPRPRHARVTPAPPKPNSAVACLENWLHAEISASCFLKGSQFPRAVRGLVAIPRPNPVAHGSRCERRLAGTAGIPGGAKSISRAVRRGVEWGVRFSPLFPERSEMSIESCLRAAMRTAARARSRRANDTRSAANYALNVTGTIGVQGTMLGGPRGGGGVSALDVVRELKQMWIVSIVSYDTRMKQVWHQHHMGTKPHIPGG